MSAPRRRLPKQSILKLYAYLVCSPYIDSVHYEQDI